MVPDGKPGQRGVAEKPVRAQLGELFAIPDPACGQPDFRRIALEEAPVALGWARWREIEEKYFLGFTAASIRGLAEAGLVNVPPGDLAARMFLAAAGEAGLAIGAASNLDEERQRAGSLVMRFLEGLR